MGYLDKDAYLRKQNYVDKRNADNEKNENLSLEQHQIIQEVGSFRHNFHCNMLSFAKCGMGDDLTYELEELLDKIKTLELPPMKLTHWVGDYLDIDDFDCVLEIDGRPDLDNNKYEEWKNKVIEKAYDEYSLTHDEIEYWLYLIDKKYGTNYCPTGHSRIY